MYEMGHQEVIAMFLRYTNTVQYRKYIEHCSDFHWQIAYVGGHRRPLDYF